jgi:hypothetical protein
MNLKEYFESRKGLGVISTANRQGQVNSAIYARPHILDDRTVAFIMRDRQTHNYISENPYATYLFKENGPGYQGVRLYLKKDREETDLELINSLSRRCLSPEEDAEKGPKFLVYFTLEKAVQLVGDGTLDVELA